MPRVKTSRPTPQAVPDLLLSALPLPTPIEMPSVDEAHPKAAKAWGAEATVPTPWPKGTRCHHCEQVKLGQKTWMTLDLGIAGTKKHPMCLDCLGSLLEAIAPISAVEASKRIRRRKPR